VFSSTRLKVQEDIFQRTRDLQIAEYCQTVFKIFVRTKRGQGQSISLFKLKEGERV